MEFEFREDGAHAGIYHDGNKILRLEIEKAHRPRAIRSIRIGGSTVDDPNLTRSIVVYFSMILAIFVFSWLLLVTFEPNSTWGFSDTLTLDRTFTTANGPMACCIANAQAVARKPACPGTGGTSPELAEGSPSNQQEMASPLKPMTLPP